MALHAGAEKIPPCDQTASAGQVPLAQISFRSGIVGTVTCSDASESGGGICRSTGLTPFGLLAAQSPVRGDIPEDHDFVQVLSVGLFDGISGLRTACDVLRLPMAGHVSVECDKAARRVVESYFIFHDDVTTVNDEWVKSLALCFPNVGLVILGSGQGVSGLNSDKRGALKDHRSSLFQEVPRIVKIFKAHFVWAQVRWLMESVASVDTKDRRIMSEGVQAQPWRIDSLGLTLRRRPRLYWADWELGDEEGVEVIPAPDNNLE